MEADPRNLPHGFSSERTHLALLGGISPENDGFKAISRILSARFLLVRPATNVCFQKFAWTELNSFWISFDCCLFKQIVCCQYGKKGGLDWEIVLSDRNFAAEGEYYCNASTELLVLTGWAARRFPACWHFVYGLVMLDLRLIKFYNWFAFITSCSC